VNEVQIHSSQSYAFPTSIAQLRILERLHDIKKHKNHAAFCVVKIAAVIASVRAIEH
jgi:hypothetical protein